MQTLWRDLCYGVRMLLKKSGFTLIAVLPIVLGIGANTAAFSAENSIQQTAGSLTLEPIVIEVRDKKNAQLWNDSNSNQ